MAEDKIDALDERLTQLERRIFGLAEKDAEYPKGTTQMVDAVHSISTQIHAATAGHKRIEVILKRINELENYLDPEYVDELLSVTAKTDAIVAAEPAICERAAHLEKIQTARLALDSDPIKAVPTLQNKLHELSKIHVTQQDESDELTSEVKQLIMSYNNIIILLTKQFLQWNETVTRLEAAAKTLPRVD